jgi:hypothetical protein
MSQDQVNSSQCHSKVWCAAHGTITKINIYKVQYPSKSSPGKQKAKLQSQMGIDAGHELPIFFL